MNWSVAALMVSAEMIGAVTYFFVKSDTVKKVMACIGLGFAYAIVFGDLLPDATQHYSAVTPLMAATMFCGLVLAFMLSKLGSAFARYSGILGFSIHNICEGFILTIVQALSPLKFLAFVLHKLPEGMASYSLLDGLRPKQRLVVILCSSLMIPLGASLSFSDQSPAARPFTMFAAGIILSAVTSSLGILLKDKGTRQRSVPVGISLASGLAIGALSCVLFG